MVGEEVCSLPNKATGPVVSATRAPPSPVDGAASSPLGRQWLSGAEPNSSGQQSSRGETRSPSPVPRIRGRPRQRCLHLMPSPCQGQHAWVREGRCVMSATGTRVPNTVREQVLGRVEAMRCAHGNARLISPLRPHAARVS